MYETISQYPFLAALLALVGLCAIFGALLGFASEKFKPEGNSVVEEINAILPQTQCGQCGYPGCRPYAEAIAGGEPSRPPTPPPAEPPGRPDEPRTEHASAMETVREILPMYGLRAVGGTSLDLGGADGHADAIVLTMIFGSQY